MWDTIFIAMAGVGAALSWQSIKHRNSNRGGPAEPPATELEHPSATPAKSMGEAFATRWQASLATGLALLVVGLSGISVQTRREIRETGPSSRDEFVDVLASDPGNTYDREEAGCVFDAIEAAGIDLTEQGSADELLNALATALPTMEEAHLDQIDACLDEETRRRGTARLGTLTDEQLREFFLTALLADPAAGIDRPGAECLLDRLKDQGMIREFADQGGDISPEFETALVEAELACL